MEKKIYALVGSWAPDDDVKQKGITVCEYDKETGHLTPIKNYFPDMKIGHTPIYHNGVIYFTDEQKHAHDQRIGGGGYVLAAKFNPENGDLELISEVKSYGVNPCFVALDRTFKYLIVAHHTSSRNCVTKIVRDENGDITTKTLYDDASMVLFRLNEDGSIGKAVDYYIQNTIGEQLSFLHSVYLIPGTDIFVTGDKGEDRVHSWKIDYKNEKIIKCDEMWMGEKTNCRYFALHPTENILYCNNEQKEVMFLYSIDKQSGKYTFLKEVSLRFGDEPNIKGMSSDIFIEPNGKYLYEAQRFVNRVVAFDLADPYNPRIIQSVPVGEQPRGFGSNKEGTILFVCNHMGDTIQSFDINNDGTLTLKETMEFSRGASIKIFD